MRFVLAGLAGLYPRHGQLVVDQIAALARTLDASRPGAYLRLAAALADGQDDRALALATEIVAWEHDHDPAWLDADTIPAAVRAGHVLAEGTRLTLYGTG